MLKMRNVVEPVRFLAFLQHRPSEQLPSVRVKSQAFRTAHERSGQIPSVQVGPQAFKSAPERF